VGRTQAGQIFGAQATLPPPISTAVKRTAYNRFEPQKPNTIARSLAIGNPADGNYAAKQILKAAAGAEDVSDPENRRPALNSWPKPEGIFAETAGGVTAGVTQKLIREGRIGPDETTVVSITGTA